MERFNLTIQYVEKGYITSNTIRKKLSESLNIDIEDIDCEVIE